MTVLNLRACLPESVNGEISNKLIRKSRKTCNISKQTFLGNRSTKYPGINEILNIKNNVSSPLRLSVADKSPLKPEFRLAQLL